MNISRGSPHQYDMMTRSTRYLEIEEISRDLEKVAWEIDPEIRDLQEQNEATRRSLQSQKVAFICEFLIQKIKEQEKTVREAEERYHLAQKRSRALYCLISVREIEKDRLSDPYMIQVFNDQIREIWNEIQYDQSEQAWQAELAELQRLKKLLSDRWKLPVDRMFYRAQINEM